jgi:tetratricopeptide (TPR) repeat protein
MHLICRPRSCCIHFPCTLLGISAHSLQVIEDIVNHLYDVHDHYYVTDKKSKSAKSELVKQLQSDVVKAVSATASNAWEPAEKARLHFLHGKALDTMKDYSEEAETQLTRAVKLDPLCWEAWNSLGSVFFKKKDLRAALDAFENSIAAKPNHYALRDASIVLRQIPDRSTVADNILASVAKAKAAVALAISNVECWTVLGTAHLAMFFAVSRAFDDLHRANQAYTRAATLEGAQLAAGVAADGPKPRVPGAWEPLPLKHDPDLHYNRGQAFAFQVCGGARGGE